MSEIENLTDQLEGFTWEVLDVIKKIESEGFTKDQAIKIVELGIKDIEAEIMHHKNSRLDSIAEALHNISQELGE